jgi:hypothetical protein
MDSLCLCHCPIPDQVADIRIPCLPFGLVPLYLLIFTPLKHIVSSDQNISLEWFFLSEELCGKGGLAG